MKLHRFWWIFFILTLAAGFFNPHLGFLAAVLLVEPFVMLIGLLIMKAHARHAAATEVPDTEESDPLYPIRRVNGFITRMIAPAQAIIFSLAATLITEVFWWIFSGDGTIAAPWKTAGLNYPDNFSFTLNIAMVTLNVVTVVLFLRRLFAVMNLAEE